MFGTQAVPSGMSDVFGNPVFGLMPYSSLVNLPKAGVPGRTVFVKDSGTVYVDNGAAFVPVGASYPLLAPSGSLGAPSYSFAGDTGTGFWRNGGGFVQLASVGVSMWLWGNNLTRMASGMVFGWSSGSPEGQANDVALSRVSAGVLGLTTGSQVQLPDGTAALPAYSFTNEPGMGLYRAGTNALGFSLGGAQVLRLLSNNLIPGADGTLDVGYSTVFFRNGYFKGGVATKYKAGTPVDGDFSTPVDGMLAVDSTASKIWTRIGGVWKGVAVV